MHERAKRAAVKGWSVGAVRRHTKWLYSVPVDEITGYGYAVTLTMRDCPETAADFHKLRRAYLMRVERMGCIRWHWVIEWQRRGVPHMHTAIYFDRELTAVEELALKMHWVALCEPYGVKLAAQYLLPITGPAGWLQYLSKHAARGAAHYQRAGKPEGWESTGRLWGHTDSWPTTAPMTFSLPRDGYFRYRRLVKAWRIADARREKDPLTRRRRMMAAKRMLRGPERSVSEVRGLSEWVGMDLNLAFLALLAQEGHHVVQVDG